MSLPKILKLYQGYIEFISHSGASQKSSYQLSIKSISSTKNNYSSLGKYHNESYRQSAKTIKQDLKTQREQETRSQANRALGFSENSSSSKLAIN